MKIRTLRSHSVQSLSFLPVCLYGWSSALLSMMSLSSARAASLAATLAMSACSHSLVWALAVASVTWAWFQINTASRFLHRDL